MRDTELYRHLLALAAPWGVEPGRAVGDGAAGRRVGHPPTADPVRLPGLRARAAGLRPFRRAGLAAPGLLPVPDLPARQPAAGGLPRARGAPGQGAVGRTELAVHRAVRAAGHRRAAPRPTCPARPGCCGSAGSKPGCDGARRRPRPGRQSRSPSGPRGRRREGRRPGPGLHHRGLRPGCRHRAVHRRRTPPGQPGRLLRPVHRRPARADPGGRDGHVGAVRSLDPRSTWTTPTTRSSSTATT